MSFKGNKNPEFLNDISEQSDVCNVRSPRVTETTSIDNLVNTSEKDCCSENENSNKADAMKDGRESKNSSQSETNKKSQNLMKDSSHTNDSVSLTVVEGGQQCDSDSNSIVKTIDSVDKIVSKSSEAEMPSNSNQKLEKMETAETEVEIEEGKKDDPSSSVSSCSSTSSASSSTSLRPSTRRISNLRLSNSQREKNQSQGRATRLSQNPDFAAKHRKFLNRVHDAIAKCDDQTDDSSSNNDSPSAVNRDRSSSCDEGGRGLLRVSRLAEKRRRESVSSGKVVNDTDNEEQSLDSDVSSVDSPKKKKISLKAENSSILKSQLPVLEGSDRYCWRCHRDGNVITCKTCPRVYHMRCTQLEAVPQSDWVCPECTAIVYAENTDTRSTAMKSLSLEQLCNLLKYTILRMKGYAGSEWFCKAVDQTEFPEYRNFVVHPMDLTLLERNIKQKRYGSTEAFLADTKWILHNCIVFNTYQSKLSNIAKSLLKICRQEMAEIENCPDCYLNAHTRKDSWFIEVCRRPHIIVWAKLKGFPFWPAKAMRTNNENHVDVRFFGAHDRAWVPVSSVYLYSRNPPATVKNKKKNNLDECIVEVEQHIKKLRDRYGKFEYAPFKTLFDPGNDEEQLRMLLPGYTPPSRSPNRRYSRVLGPIRSFEGTDQSENKQLEIKIEESEKLENKKMAVSNNKKVLKENKNIFDNNVDDDGIEKKKSAKNDYVNKSADDAEKVEAISNAVSENCAGIHVDQQLESGEPNLIFRGNAVKRQLSTVYDGGGDGIESVNGVSTDDGSSNITAREPLVSVKVRRKSFNNIEESKCNTSINQIKVLKTYHNKNSKSNVKSHISSENYNSNKKIVVETDERSTDILRSLELMSSKVAETDSIVILRSVNSNFKQNCDNNESSNSNSYLTVTQSNKDCVPGENAEDGDASKSGNSKDDITVEDVINDKSDAVISDTSCSSNSSSSSSSGGSNSCSSSNSSFSNDDNDVSILDESINIAQPVVVLCDIVHGDKNNLNVSIKHEHVSDDENVAGEMNAFKTSNEISSRNNNVCHVEEKLVDDLPGTNLNDTESDCSSKDNSVTEIEIDKPPLVTIDLENDKCSDVAILPDDSHLKIIQDKSMTSPSESSELHNKVMLDSTDESPLVIIDEISEVEQNQRQKETVSSEVQNQNSSRSSSPMSTSDKEQSLHHQILKSVLENSCDNNSTSNLEKTVLMNRRKSKPVKIRSRSNTSSSEDAVEELKRICEEQESFRKTNENQTIEEVLDEVSGRFRRKENSNSEDPNVTITLVSDDEPQKSTPTVKEIRPSVALSHDVSLTVIDNTEGRSSNNSTHNNISNKDLPTSLEMECVESDTDEPVLVNETRLKPTARKTFPNPVPVLKSESIVLNKPLKTFSKNDLQITAVSNQPTNMNSNKLTVPKLRTNSGVDEIKISNTMSLKLQSIPKTASTNLNGKLSSSSSSSPPLVLPNHSSNSNFRNPTTTQARVLPLLQPKPPPAAVTVDVPLSGPTSVQLDNCSQKLAQRFRSMLEEILRDMSSEGSTEATVKALQLEMEKLQWKHRQELAELKHNTDLIIMEMRASLEAEKQRIVMETKMKCEAEKESAINETKMKQWCALCKKEALFYCCWNTAYCNYPCQQAHWPQHMSVCAQTSRAGSETTVTKTTSAPKSISTGFSGNSNNNKTVCFPAPNSNQQISSPSSKHHNSPANTTSMSFIPLSLPQNVTSCGSSTYNRSKNTSTVITSGHHSGPGNPYYLPGISAPQNGSMNAAQLHMSQQSDMKLMPPPSQHQTNISYSRIVNGKMHSQPSLPPPPPLPPTVSQLHSYRQLSVSVRPPQYFMLPRGAPTGGFYH